MMPLVVNREVIAEARCDNDATLLVSMESDECFWGIVVVVSLAQQILHVLVFRQYRCQCVLDRSCVWHILEMNHRAFLVLVICHLTEIRETQIVSRLLVDDSTVHIRFRILVERILFGIELGRIHHRANPILRTQLIGWLCLDIFWREVIQTHQDRVYAL